MIKIHMSVKPVLRLLVISIIVTQSLVAPASAAETPVENPLLVESRALTQAFAVRLQTALQAAMRDAGPLAALGVCRDVAPQIASELSRLSGAKVSRTSRRFRNPANAPEPWQSAVLDDFEARAPNDDTPLEHFVSDSDGARYMKAIRIAPVCQVCHGATLSNAVQQRLDADYPHDRARGYEAGDLRGAFSIVWPVTD